MDEPTFKNINRQFLLSFKAGINDLLKDQFDKYYITTILREDFNVLIDNKPFLNWPIKQTRNR